MFQWKPHVDKDADLTQWYKAVHEKHIWFLFLAFYVFLKK